jgi:di/tricarboxylate transporter
MLDIIRAFIADHQAGIGLFVLGLMLIGFILERFPPTVVAILGTVVFLIMGTMDEKALYSVFSNSAPVTIGAMFVLSGALLRTGAIDAIAGWIIARARTHPKRAIAEMMVGVYIASAFMNNTPVVVVMIPIIIRLAQAISMSPKKLLIPLSFVTILGGTTTLIGTSTNLLVDGVARDAGLPAMGIFSITPYGLIAGIVGMAMMALFSRHLLPKDEDTPNRTLAEEEAGFLTEVRILPTSDYIGKKLSDISLAKRSALKFTALKRGATFMRTGILEMTLQAEDRLVARLSLTELLSMRKNTAIEIGITAGGSEHIGHSEKGLVEATVSPTHPSIGNRLREIPFLSNLNVRILGVSRFRKVPGPDLGSARIHAVDRLLVTGPTDQIEQMHLNPNLFGVGETTAREFRRSKAPIAIGALVAVVLLSTFDILPIGVAAIIAIGVILLTRCIDAEEAWASIDGNVLVLIYAMLAVGLALEETGSVTMVVGAMTPYLSTVPPWGLLIAVYVVAVLLTEIITNNAVAILVTPVVIKLAQDLGQDPMPLVIAVMFAASASFATPIGYQTNTLVYAAGGYKFTDFFRAGIPLTLGVGVATILAIALLA